MPIVTVYGLPADMNEQAIQALYRDLENAFVGVKEMGVTEEMLTFNFPADRMMFGLGKEVNIWVIASNKPERTDEVRARLVEALSRTTETHLPNATVEVIVLPFDPRWGFWLSSEHK